MEAPSAGMALYLYDPGHRPRELRRNVVLPARMRHGLSWSDACILNISSRGLMIQSGRAAPQGSVIELRRGDHVIPARVMWSEGSRTGLQVDDRLPTDELLALCKVAQLKIGDVGSPLIERRSDP